MRHSKDQLDRLARDVAELGVASACAKHGIHRSTWYRRRSGEGEKKATRTRTERLREPVERLALEHPAWGCDRLAYYLSFSGIRVSSPTIQKILKAQALGRRSDREAARLAATSSTDRAS